MQKTFNRFTKQFVGNTRFSKIHFKKPGLLHCFLCTIYQKEEGITHEFHNVKHWELRTHKREGRNQTMRVLSKQENPHRSKKKKVG